MSLFTLLLGLQMAFHVSASLTPSYSMVAPSLLRPNSDYSVLVSSHNTSRPLRLSVEVSGNNDFESRQEAVLQPDTTQLLKFQMGDLDPDQYYLSVLGVGGGMEDFRNITSLQFSPKSYSVLVETDRPVYRPGGLVRFRVLVVNPGLRPTVTGAIDALVKDGAGVPVKKFSRVFTNKGMWADQLQLALEPRLGNWTLQITVLGQVFTGYFQVRELVAPKFDVTVGLPSFVSLEDAILPVMVTASYPQGRPILGEITLQITPRYKYEYLQAPYDAPVSIVKPFEGRLAMDVHLLNDLKLGGEYSRTLEVSAYVREARTSRVQNSTAYVTVYRLPYALTFLRSSDTFKPGLAYTAYLRVAQHDGTPITSGTVSVRHAFVRDANAFTETTHDISDTGLVTISVQPPLTGPSHTLAFEATYRNLTQWLGEVPKAHSPSDTFVQTTLLTEAPTVGEEVVVALNATRSLVYFVYEVSARGNTLYGTTLQAHRGTTHTFRFVATRDMFPRARLVVYWLAQDGEVVADGLAFDVAMDPKKKVTLTVNPGSVSATGDRRVTITVSGQPNAVLGVTGVDTITLGVMGEQHRLTQEDLMNELHSYDSGASGLAAEGKLLSAEGTSNPPGLVARRVRREEAHRPCRSVRPAQPTQGSSAAWDVFQNAGTILMTNGVVARGFHGALSSPTSTSNWDPSSLPPAMNGPFGRVPISRQGGSTLKPDRGPALHYTAHPRPPLAGPYAFSHLPPPPDHTPRHHLSRHLPPPWLFEHRSTGRNGIVSWEEEVPYTPYDVTYSLSVVTVDDFRGVQVSEDTVEVSLRRPLDITVELPSSVVAGEAVAVALVVHNGQTANVTATVTFTNEERRFVFPADFEAATGNTVDTAAPSASVQRVVTVPSGGVMSLSVMVVPVEAGDTLVSVAVSDGVNSAEANATLHVMLGGSTMSVSKALYMDPYQPAAADATATLNITTPRNIVPGSLKIKMTAYGDVLGPVAMAPLTPLTPLVGGGGEMVAARMVPIVTALQHLESTAGLSRVLGEEASAELELLLQTLLRHRNEDGSFVEFAEYRDPVEGSVWLTAFVAKTLRAASAHVFVADHVIRDALAWLVRQQNDAGAFVSTASTASNASGTNTSVTARRNEPLALTAYVLLAILQVEDYTTPAVRNAGNRALDYLVASLRTQQAEGSDGLALAASGGLALALATYAMHVASHPYRDTAFYLLEAQAKTADNMKWWDDVDGQTKTRVSLEDESLTTSLAIEQTAYALLTYVTRGSAADSGGIVRWLSGHRNARGGFTTSQDTAVGVAALAAVSAAHQTSNGASPLTLRLVYGGRGSMVVLDQPLVVRDVVLPEDTTSVSVTSSGSHAGLLVLSYTYNLQVSAPRPAFSLDPQLDRTTDAHRLRLTACAGLLVSSANPSDRSNVAVMEVELPSGYVIDDTDLSGLYDYPTVARVEKLPYDAEAGRRGGVALYFHHLSAVEVCPTITASRVNHVARQRPSVVRLYDYYDLTRQARQFYSAAPATLCDICDVEECDSAVCAKQAGRLGRQRQAEEDAGYPAVVVPQDSSAIPVSACLAVVWVGLCASLLLTVHP